MQSVNTISDNELMRQKTNRSSMLVSEHFAEKNKRANIERLQFVNQSEKVHYSSLKSKLFDDGTVRMGQIRQMVGHIFKHRTRYNT